MRHPENLIEYEKVSINVVLYVGNQIKADSSLDRNIGEAKNSTHSIAGAHQNLNALISEELLRHFPNHEVIVDSQIGERSKPTDKPIWLVSAFDSQLNFEHTFPYVCISIALVVNSDPIIGVVYNPFLNKLYTAKKHFGAYCNGSRIRVRSCESLQDALILFEFSVFHKNAQLNEALKNTRSLFWSVRGTRAMGSAAMDLCTVASGSANASFHFDSKSSQIAAAVLILTEAGGYAIDTNGDRFNLMSANLIAACDENIAKILVSIVESIPDALEDIPDGLESSDEPIPEAFDSTIILESVDDALESNEDPVEETSVESEEDSNLDSMADDASESREESVVDTPGAATDKSLGALAFKLVEDMRDPVKDAITDVVDATALVSDPVLLTI
ncbi:hypothetical protein B4U79_04120 [Dinothrombium tinctorium]|uniref:Inositol-phosphate phosphatase n=1 Tax=Dinothrombium tinctorium TaxID=1965070 RepID=A0A443R1C4_9ACAR|nr:hypothetical protein B4U79_04120 [Dinothrombium tinctorium]